MAELTRSGFDEKSNTYTYPFVDATACAFKFEFEDAGYALLSECTSEKPVSASENRGGLGYIYADPTLPEDNTVPANNVIKIEVGYAEKMKDNDSTPIQNDVIHGGELQASIDLMNGEEFVSWNIYAPDAGTTGKFTAEKEIDLANTHVDSIENTTSIIDQLKSLKLTEFIINYNLRFNYEGMTYSLPVMKNQTFIYNGN